MMEHLPSCGIQMVLNCMGCAGVGSVMPQGLVWRLFLILILHRYWSIWQELLALLVLCDLQYRSRGPLMPACLPACPIWMDSPSGTVLLSSAVVWTVEATGTLNCAAVWKHCSVSAGSNTLLDHLHCCTTCLCLIFCEHVASTAVEFCCKLLVCWILCSVLAAEVFKFYPWMCWHGRFFQDCSHWYSNGVKVSIMEVTSLVTSYIRDVQRNNLGVCHKVLHLLCGRIHYLFRM